MQVGLTGEERWRDAMQNMGKEAVKAKLHARPGSSDDPVFDIVHTAPFPTRAFCIRWCAEEESRLFRFSGHTVVMLFLVVLVAVSLLRAISSLSGSQQLTADAAVYAGAAPPAAYPAAAVEPAGNTPFGRYPSAGLSAGGQTVPSSCAYIPYATSQCPKSATQ